MNAQQYENLLVEIDGPTAIVTINRPKALNALNPTTIRELAACIRSLRDEPEVRAIILTGAGDRAFVAGADIAAMVAMSTIDALAFSRLGHDTLRMLEEIEKPVIAAVNGFALGGGCELALACDIILASERARFGQPEVKLGIMPGFGGTQRLGRRVGLGAARLLIYTGEAIDAKEAERIGLADRVVPPDQLLAAAKEVAASVTEKAPLAISAAKQAILHGADMDLANANAFEAESFARLFATRDQEEGMAAFLEKRNPVFTGE
jgi:enoyl-CoA hydratase